jgi:hypothetical protein
MTVGGARAQQRTEYQEAASRHTIDRPPERRHSEHSGEHIHPSDVADLARRGAQFLCQELWQQEEG